MTNCWAEERGEGETRNRSSQFFLLPFLSKRLGAGINAHSFNIIITSICCTATSANVAPIERLPAAKYCCIKRKKKGGEFCVSTNSFFYRRLWTETWMEIRFTPWVFGAWIVFLFFHLCTTVSVCEEKERKEHWNQSSSDKRESRDRVKKKPW